MATSAKKRKDEKETDKNRDLVKLAIERFEKSRTADKDNRSEAVEDLKFVAGQQWPDNLKTERDAAFRPTLVIDKINEKIRQVVGDQRQSRPGIKVRPFDKRADKETADVIEGIIRHIEHNSQSETVYDHVFESELRCGLGYCRVLTQYATEDSAVDYNGESFDAGVFDQEIRIELIPDPMSVVRDHAARKIDLSDARYWFISTWFGRKEYKARFKRNPVEFESADTEYVDWVEEDQVRVAEYWVKEKDPTRTRTLHLMEDGAVYTAEDLPEGAEPVKTRKVQAEKIVQYLIDGRDVLERHEWAGRYFPIVEVRGEQIIIDGKQFIRGLVRLAKDPQRMHNYFESMVTETVALMPKAPWLLSADMIDGYQKYWDQADSSSQVYLIYNTDPANPAARPHREPPPSIPTGLEQRSQANSDHIKSAMGLHDASLGARSNETSGAAIRARQHEGDVGTFLFIDNLARGIAQIGRILVDLIPRIYDSKRTQRILGVDGIEKTVQLANAGDGHGELANGDKAERIYDLSVGRYDVVVDTGPSFTTQRQEAADSQKELITSLPDLARYMIDLYVKNSDWPESDEVAERVRLFLAPEVQAKIAEKEQANGDQLKSGDKRPPTDRQPQTIEEMQALLTAQNQGAAPDAMSAPGEAELATIRVEQERERLRKLKAEAAKAEEEAEMTRMKKTALMSELGIDPARTQEELEEPEMAEMAV